MLKPCVGDSREATLAVVSMLVEGGAECEAVFDWTWDPVRVPRLQDPRVLAADDIQDAQNPRRRNPTAEAQNTYTGLCTAGEDRPMLGPAAC